MGSCVPQSLCEGGYDYPHLTDKGTEAQSSIATCLRLHSLPRQDLDFGFWTSRFVLTLLHHVASLFSILIVLTHLGASVLLGGGSGRRWSRAGSPHKNLGRQGLPPALRLQFLCKGPWLN